MIDYGADEIFEDEENHVIIYGAFEAFGTIQKFWKITTTKWSVENSNVFLLIQKS